MTTTIYEYVCGNNHQLTSPKPLDKCVGCVDGKPCTSDLKRIGKGSRGGKP